MYIRTRACSCVWVFLYLKKKWFSHSQFHIVQLTKAFNFTVKVSVSGLISIQWVCMMMMCDEVVWCADGEKDNELKKRVHTHTHTHRLKRQIVSNETTIEWEKIGNDWVAETELIHNSLECTEWVSERERVDWTEACALCGRANKMNRTQKIKTKEK